MDMKRVSQTNRLSQGVIAGFSVALLAIGFSTPAHASAWSLSDDFEYQPATRWQLYHSDNGSGGFNTNAGTARSGTTAAWLSVQTGWTSVGRTVRITPTQMGYQPSCAVQISIQPFMPVEFNFEVIDPGTWTYVSLKKVTLMGGAYQTVTSASFTPPHPDVFVRVALGSSGSSSVKAVNVDDLAVYCQYF